MGRPSRSRARVWTPSASSPTPAVRAPRPTAISTCSASSRPPSVSTTTPGPPGFTAETFTPVLIVIPRRPNRRASRAETSSSSIGSTRGNASSRVTCGAVGGVDVGELHAHRAGADDDERGRRALVADGAVGGDHQLLVDGDAGQRLGLGAGGQDDAPGLERLGAGRALHLDGALATCSVPVPGNERDLVLPEQELHALGHAVGDPAAALAPPPRSRPERCRP